MKEEKEIKETASGNTKPIWKGTMDEFKQISSEYEGNKLKHLKEQSILYKCTRDWNDGGFPDPCLAYTPEGCTSLTHEEDCSWKEPIKEQSGVGTICDICNRIIEEGELHRLKIFLEKQEKKYYHLECLPFETDTPADINTPKCKTCPRIKNEMICYEDPETCGYEPAEAESKPIMIGDVPDLKIIGIQNVKIMKLMIEKQDLLEEFIKDWKRFAKWIDMQKNEILSAEPIIEEIDKYIKEYKKRLEELK